MMKGNGIIIVVLATIAVFAIAGFAVLKGIRAQDIALIGFIIFGAVIVLFAGAVLYNIGNGTIDLQGIIAEPRNPEMDSDEQPKASLSRFQFLIFTFVVAGLFLMLSIEAGQFVNIPNNVLVLIGLSGTGYLAGKMTGSPVTSETLENPKVKAAKMKANAEKLQKEANEAKAAAKAAEAAAKAAS